MARTVGLASGSTADFPFDSGRTPSHLLPVEVTDGPSFVKYMRTVRKRTDEVLEQVPAEREQWRLEPTSMTVPEILFHVAATEKAIYGPSLRGGGPGPLDELPRGLSLTEAREYAREARGVCEAYWTTMTAAELAAQVATPTGFRIQLGRWLVLAPEHEIHHRGVIHAYRKIWGLASVPIYGLTFEQLQERLRV